jgi:hypothetical protein
MEDDHEVSAYAEFYAQRREQAARMRRTPNGRTKDTRLGKSDEELAAPPGPTATDIEAMKNDFLNRRR